jgi:hypothetical protein
MTPAVQARLVAAVDEICLANGAFRYLHSLTGTDPAKLARLDPNALYGGREVPAAGHRNGQAEDIPPAPATARGSRGRKQVEETVG